MAATQRPATGYGSGQVGPYPASPFCTWCDPEGIEHSDQCGCSCHGAEGIVLERYLDRRAAQVARGGVKVLRADGANQPEPRPIRPGRLTRAQADEAGLSSVTLTQRVIDPNWREVSSDVRAECRLEKMAGKVIEHYQSGKLTFAEFVTMLGEIDDSRIYEEEAARDYEN